MVFHVMALGPTQGQMMDLAQGEEVKLSHHHLDGEYIFHLTTAQKKKVDLASMGNRGCTLKLSKAQIKRHATHGEGLFKDLASAGYKMLAPVVRGGITKALDYGGDKLEGLAQQGIRKGVAFGKAKAQSGLEGALGVTSGKGFFKNLLRKGAHGLVDVAADAMGGSVADQGNVHKCNHCHGTGFLGNILKKLAHGGVDVLATALGGSVGKRTKKCHHCQGTGFLSDLIGSLGLGVGPKVKHSNNFVVDPNVRPNPLANPNEQLYANLQKKKGQGLYVAGGNGLYVPGRQ